MHRQLEEMVVEFEQARSRLAALARRIPETQWSVRPDPVRWSAGECVAHLNLTAAAFLPRLRDGLAQARALETRAPARYRRDVVGWLLWNVMGPPVRQRVKTPPPFVPAAVESRDELLARFNVLQDEQLAFVREADGLPIDVVKIVSPFNARVTYSLYSALTILPRHQHRHLWQAERVGEALGV
jgi:hypothetical protein